jgi:hypothetical protein
MKGVNSHILDKLLSTQGISTPNLEDLTIKMNCCWHNYPDSTFLSNFITSLHHLQWFKVVYYDDNPKWVFNWLLNIPSLSELDFQIPTSALANIVSALGNLTLTETTITYLPLLVHLTITFSHFYKINLMIKDIPEMLPYRSSELSPSISRLKSALLYWTQASVPFYKEDFEAFQMVSLGDLAFTMVDQNGLSQPWCTLFFSLI